jgi:hypothetical protein
MITFNRRLQFTSNLWAELCDMLNILHRQTTAYHPEVNSADERLHPHLKNVLRVCTTVATWDEEIPWVLLGLHSQSREDTGLSLSEVVFGALVALPNEFLQAKEFSLDQISEKFPKSLMPCFFSASKHNSGH